MSRTENKDVCIYGLFQMFVFLRNQRSRLAAFADMQISEHHTYARKNRFRICMGVPDPDRSFASLSSEFVAQG